MTVATSDVASATIDLDGRLVRADQRLASLNAAAGGGEGLPLALPAIAALARLARRLGIVIARPAVVADGEADIELWVRARPTAAGTEIEVSGWPVGEVEPATAPRDRDRFDEAEAQFAWECDAAMLLTALTGEGLDGGAIGQPLTRMFDLSTDDALIPLLAAAANRGSFADQPARIAADGRAVRLGARALVDGAGAFAGFVGIGRFADAPPEPDAPPPPAFGEQFADRLDRALRTPLQRIVAHADSIGAQADGPVRPEYVEYAQDISSAARHLMGLVDDLVDLSAIERPDFAVEAEPIDLADVARRAAGLLAVRATNADVRIDRPAIDDVLPAIGEFRRALQILVNLIGNAVRYSPRGGMVWLRLDRGAGGVAVTVADQGRGIAREDQARIFDKFGRVDTNEPGGNGLGLYIARRLARAMGGDVTVDSEPGQGARFTLTLPEG
ncbi:PAS domain-containing sensor histidine kinase [Sphingomonas spermidinifaciens]|uniref:histidine kinase n=1 Tax=Sphingomonas spermidinifaciens TaxID=1141889 RepID=A0A2A4B4K3_9SPHN|nr:HAMP domain-containing sensor histidine kinase [Sphingomonas spermidinifaciens]PCD02977.1 PAS domain-containing sensor histidine kinase [Sphingomonas spermidinifaciens]